MDTRRDEVGSLVHERSMTRRLRSRKIDYQ